ncbi:MAG: RNA-binding transcriptional accessory protein [Bdellovibrionales bacterium]|nr:RNA-binding transcriptional accessory protein [Bdellovibrionales bacterium]
MEFQSWLKERHPSIPAASAMAVLQLAAEGATVPFIARYRKERTGNLDEVSIRDVIEGKGAWDRIAERKEFILGEIEKQQKLTPELKAELAGCYDLTRLEDLYLPYKIKRKTKAQKAREAGLEPLADWIWACGHGTETPQPGQTLELWSLTYRNEAAGITNGEEAVAGAQDILVERLSEDAELRAFVRGEVFQKGVLRTEKGDKAKTPSKFELYFKHEEPVGSLKKPESSHRYLAMRRGWMEGELKLAVGGPAADAGFDDRLLARFEGAALSVPDSPGAETLRKAARLALRAHVAPAIENEVHAALREVAEEVAIKVFGENVRKLLLAAPFGPKPVLGVDPGVRTGCKCAVVDDSGKMLGNFVLQLQSETGKQQAKTLVPEVLKGANIRAIAVGNGTAGRETEGFLRALLKECGAEVPVVMVNEAGASVYSASDVAREEFPDLDVTVRGAISIARRLQDPLAELVKIDPKSIGVGQYQHDVSQPALKRNLDAVVDSCVNSVGVNLNTASSHLLARVSGIGPALAKALVEHRSQKGLFKSRTQLLEVSRFSDKIYEQAAGFLRIPDSGHPLDNTGVHPERYGALESAAKGMDRDVRDLIGQGVSLLKKAGAALKEQLGAFTFDDIVAELEKPGRDPREAFVPFHFRDDIHELKDLKPAMVCPGIVTNVTNFGAFVDIGVHQDGLVHISQLANRFVKDPREVVSPGDRVQVTVLEVSLEKKQIALTMKVSGGAKSEAHRRSRDTEQESGSRPRRVERAPRAPREQKFNARNAPRGGRDGARDPGPQPKAAPKKPQQPFNNPFAAALGGIKTPAKR